VVPATPQVLAATPPRVYGDGAKLFMIVHEMVHACGLFNSDHCEDDVFAGYPNFIPGQNPADDKFEVDGQRKLPPLFMVAKTIGIIQKNWK
jgi:hypothetical protein